MSLVKVSVIMPAYNMAPYIDEAIQSVLVQRGVPFELLIGDDGSTDGTWRRIQRYRADPRVRACRSRRNRGAGAMRNRLIALARGVYLSICDADDLLLPGSLCRSARVLDRGPAIGVVHGNRRVIHSRGRPDTYHRIQGPDETWDLLGGHVGNGGTMIRRTVMQAIGGYRTDLPFMEDYELFLRLAEITRFCHVGGQALCRYRIRPGSLSDQPRRVREAVARVLRRRTIARRYGIQVPW